MIFVALRKYENNKNIKRNVASLRKDKIWCKDKGLRGIPDSPVVRTLCFHCQAWGFNQKLHNVVKKRKVTVILLVDSKLGPIFHVMLKRMLTPHQETWVKPQLYHWLVSRCCVPF